MNVCLVLVGISGSGKSTYSDYLRRVGFEVFSSDEIRKELWGDENDQKNPSEVFNTLHRRILSALKEGKNCVYDATNISAKKRAAFIRMVKGSNINCEFACRVFVTTPKECIERDKKRDRTVGANVIWKQIKHFEVPSYSEGWDEINLFVTGKEHLDLDAIVDTFSGTLYDEHDNPHHSLTISEHMSKAAEYILNNTGRGEQSIAYIAAKYHDIGKYFTKTNVDRLGDITEDSHFYGHHNVGSYLFLCSTCAKALERDNCILNVAFLIQHHMDHYIRNKDSLDKFYKENDFSLIRELHFVEKADKEAH